MVTGIVEKQKEKTVICLHKENIDSHGHGVCKICDQIRQYDLEFPTRPPVVVKRGRINGVLTEMVPNANSKLEVAPEPAIELKEAAPQCAPDNWGTLSNIKKHAWLEKRRTPLTADLETIGLMPTCRKWHLPMGTLFGLSRQWGVKSAKLRRTKAAPAPARQGEAEQPTEGITKAECAPDNWDKKTKKQKTDWLKAHRKPLTADLETIGLLATAKKWNLSEGTLGGLARRWGLFLARPKRPAMLPATKTPYTQDPLPPFPAFNEEWSEKMQMAWLRAYTSCRVAETEGSKK